MIIMRALTHTLSYSAFTREKKVFRNIVETTKMKEDKKMRAARVNGRFNRRISDTYKKINGKTKMSKKVRLARKLATKNSLGYSGDVKTMFCSYSKAVTPLMDKRIAAAIIALVTAAKTSTYNPASP